MNLGSFVLAFPAACVLLLACGCSSGSSSPSQAPPLSGSSTSSGSGSCSTTSSGGGACTLTDGLTGWWKGEDNTDDSAGSANGAWTGMPAYAAGVIGQGFAFGGMEFVRIPFTQQGPLTIDFWALSTASANGMYEAAFASGDVAMAPYFQVDSDGDGNYRLFAQTSITVGATTAVFQHIAITFDGSTVITYLDGVQTGTVGWTGDQPLQFVTLKIGSNRITSRFFKGTIDELHIWNRALSATEIAELHALTCPTLCP
jgi:Concanavalin A-like lectin/glucanases superfamily